MRPLQNVAALGLVAIMVAAQPQMAMAAPSTGPTQVGLCPPCSMLHGCVALTVHQNGHFEC